MRFALVNPRWSFEGSTYFGCPDPHFPLELLSAREFLRGAGHQVPSHVSRTPVLLLVPRAGAPDSGEAVPLA